MPSTFENPFQPSLFLAAPPTALASIFSAISLFFSMSRADTHDEVVVWDFLVGRERQLRNLGQQFNGSSRLPARSHPSWRVGPRLIWFPFTMPPL
jgi:hypothetical protein